MVIKVLSGAEFPLDCKKDGVIILPVNLQGLMDFSDNERRFKHEFPITFKQYVRDCVIGEVYAGSIKHYEERGYKITLLYYKMYEVGRHGQTDEKHDLYLSQCLTKLFQFYGEGTKFYSSNIKFTNSARMIWNNKQDFIWNLMQEGDT